MLAWCGTAAFLKAFADVSTDVPSLMPDSATAATLDAVAKEPSSPLPSLSSLLSEPSDGMSQSESPSLSSSSRATATVVVGIPSSAAARTVFSLNVLAFDMPSSVRAIAIACSMSSSSMCNFVFMSVITSTSRLGASPILVSQGRPRLSPWPTRRITNYFRIINYF